MSMMSFNASLLDAQHERDREKKKSAKKLTVYLGKTSSKISPFICNGHMVGRVVFPPW